MNENIYYLISRIICAGLPAITTSLGKDFVTTDPAPTIVLSPIFTPGSIVADPPIQTLLAICTGNPCPIDFCRCL